MIKISCKEYATNLKEELKELCEKSPRQRCLTVIQVGDDKASKVQKHSERLMVLVLKWLNLLVNGGISTT